MSVFDATWCHLMPLKAALRQPLTDPQKISRRHDIVPWLTWQGNEDSSARDGNFSWVFVRQLRWRCWWVRTHSYETLRTPTHSSLSISYRLGMIRLSLRAIVKAIRMSFLWELEHHRHWNKFRIICVCVKIRMHNLKKYRCRNQSLLQNLVLITIPIIILIYTRHNRHKIVIIIIIILKNDAEWCVTYTRLCRGNYVGFPTWSESQPGYIGHMHSRGTPRMTLWGRLLSQLGQLDPVDVCCSFVVPHEL